MEVQVFSGVQFLGFFPLSEVLEEVSIRDPTRVFDKAPFLRPANIRQTGQLLDFLDKGQDIRVLYTDSVHDWFADRGNKVEREGYDLVVSRSDYQEYQPSLETPLPVSLESFTDYFEENLEDYDAAGNFLALLDEKEQEFLETNDLWAGRGLSVTFSRKETANFFALFLHNKYPYGLFTKEGFKVTFHRWREVTFPEGRSIFLEKVENLLSFLEHHYEEPEKLAKAKEQLSPSYWDVLDRRAEEEGINFVPSALASEEEYDLELNHALRDFLRDVLASFRRPDLETVSVPRLAYGPLVEYVPLYVTKGDPIVLLHFGTKEDAWRIIGDTIRAKARERDSYDWE